jgi:hypothetical protein
MSNQLIAWVVAVGFGATVVVVGLRRDLSETTRDNLPRFGEDSESATVAVAPPEDGWERRPLSPRQARWLAVFDLALALRYVAEAVLSSDDRLLHAAMAAALTLSLVVLVLRDLRRPSDTAAS